jgi:hypothetical protein
MSEAAPRAVHRGAIRSPGRRSWARQSFPAAGSRRAVASIIRPSVRNTSLSAGAPRSGRDTACACTGSTTVGKVDQRAAHTRVSTALTPGSRPAARPAGRARAPPGQRPRPGGSVRNRRARVVQRGDQPRHHHQHHHTHGDDHADGEGLTLHAPQVAQELVVERAHQSISSGASFVGCSARSRGSRRRQNGSRGRPSRPGWRHG